MSATSPTRLLNAVLFAVAFVIAGCTQTATVSSGLHPWTHPDELRIASPTNPNTLNPILPTQEYEVVPIALMFSPLVAMRPDGTDAGILAERVPSQANGDVSKDGLRITYHLRHGVKWQDGAPFSSRDVAFTWRAILNPNTASSTHHGYDIVASIDTPDPYTAIVHLKHPFAPFVQTFFAHSDEPMDVLPEHLLAKYRDLNQVPFNAMPIGTGPYKLVHWYRGDRLEFVANDAYFQGKPAIAKIVIHIVPDENTIVAEMKSHEIDWFVSASPRTYRQLQGVPGIDERLIPFNGYDGIQFNTAAKPVDDARVRRAIGLAIDKRALVRSVTYGVELPAREDLPSFMWASDPHAGTIDRDLPRARALLSAAGWLPGPDGIRVKNGNRLILEIAFRTDALTDRNRGVVIAQMLRDAGIDVSLKGYPTSLLYAAQSGGGIMAQGKYESALTTWYAGEDPDDSTQLLCDQFPPTGLNWSRYCNRAVDAAEATALSHYDRPTRTRAYAAVQEALAADAPYIYLWWPRQLEPVNDDLKHFEPNGIVEDWNAYAWSFGK